MADDHLVVIDIGDLIRNRPGRRAAAAVQQAPETAWTE